MRTDLWILRIALTFLILLQTEPVMAADTSPFDCDGMDRLESYQDRHETYLQVGYIFSLNLTGTGVIGKSGCQPIAGLNLPNTPDIVDGLVADQLRILSDRDTVSVENFRSTRADNQLPSIVLFRSSMGQSADFKEVALKTLLGLKDYFPATHLSLLLKDEADYWTLAEYQVNDGHSQTYVRQYSCTIRDVFVLFSSSKPFSRLQKQNHAKFLTRIQFYE